jgi:DNA polymerase-3 subunit epsilon
MIVFDKKTDNALSKNGIDKSNFLSLLDEPYDLSFEILKARGIGLVQHKGRYYYESVFCDLDDATFCIVDIETNGSRPSKHQIIEIGAVKVKNRTIIDTFESLIRCDAISSHISEITGITAEETQEAPDLKTVMEAFHIFLADAVFVAHAVKFDYEFISAMMQQVGLAPLMNRSLCTIDLAERTISSYRYGLEYLNKQLDLYGEATHHRALSDAMTATKLFKKTLQFIPENIHSAEDLIRFSKEAARLKRPKFDPNLTQEKAEN